MAYARLGTKSAGSIVKININGTVRELLVLHQGKPSSVYDDSFNGGTIVCQKDFYSIGKWADGSLSNDNSDYANSSVHAEINSTFYNQIDSAIRSQIKTVKIPYSKGYGSKSSVVSGSSGLSCKVFLLSGTEVGLGDQTGSNWNDTKYLPTEGARLDYFSSTSKRIAYNGSTAYKWWLRSPSTSTYRDYYVWWVNADGTGEYGVDNQNFGIRPAFVLPSALYVADDGTLTTNTAPSTPGRFTISVRSSSDHSFNIAWGSSSDAEGNLVGYVLQRTTNKGSSWDQIFKGSGTEIVDYPSLFTTTVTYRVAAYDSEGLYSDWRYSDSTTVTINTAPSTPGYVTVTTPSGINIDPTLKITWGASTDAEGNLSGYVLERFTNTGGRWMQVYQGSATTFTDNVTGGASNVMYRVKAYDSEGLESDWRTSGDIIIPTNKPPVVSVNSTALGEKNEPFALDYIVSDPDNDTLTVTEQLDSKTTATHPGVTSGTTLTFGQASTEDDFRRILNGDHTIQITASDGRASTSANVTFSKAVHSASISLVQPMAVSDPITAAVLTVTGSIPADAIFKVEATNNALDDSPVWQDVTEEVRKGVNIVFDNQTAAKGAAFNFRVSVARGPSGTGGYIEAVSGAFQ